MLTHRQSQMTCGLVCVVTTVLVGCDSATNTEGMKSERIDELAATIIAGEDDIGRSGAIYELKSLGSAAGPALRRVFQQSEDRATRIEVAHAIAETVTLEAVPDLMDAMEEEDVELRAASNDALQSMMGGVSVRYDPAAPAEVRRAAIERWRAYWNRRNTPEMNAIGIDNAKAKKAMQEQTIFE
ncbi:MAG: hypothetical protein MI757_10050 [Pirellulales bacterium]|nr:hypothetical protein [Pirellulales bacterium]